MEQARTKDSPIGCLEPSHAGGRYPPSISPRRFMKVTEKKTYPPDALSGWVHEIIPDDLPDCPYLERWRLNIGLPGKRAWFGIRLHHFFRSDEDHLHDHPFWFVTLVLRGSYEDWIGCPDCKGSGWNHFSHLPFSEQGLRYCQRCESRGQIVGTRMTPGTVRYRPALHRHRVVTDGCWTLVLSGPKIRDWGFWVNGAWMRQRAYFRKYGGSAACE